MSHAQSQRYAKGRATQSCARSVAPQAISRGSLRACADVLYFSPPGVSLPGTSPTFKGTGSRCRSQDRFHCKALSGFSRQTPGVRIFHRADLERHRQPCGREVIEPRAKTWLRSRRMASGWPFGWNIGLIACWPKSSLKLMNCWYRNSGDGLIMSVARRS